MLSFHPVLSFLRPAGSSDDDLPQLWESTGYNSDINLGSVCSLRSTFSRLHLGELSHDSGCEELPSPTGAILPSFAQKPCLSQIFRFLK